MAATLQHVRTQFNLSEVGTATGGTAADIFNNVDRGTGEAGYSEFLEAARVHHATSFTLIDIEYARDLNTQIMVFDGEL